MVRRSAVVGSVVVSLLALACGGGNDGEAFEGTEDALSARTVDITVSAKRTGETYEARAYPVDDVDGDGRTEYYRAPVFYVYIDGTNAAGVRERRVWKTPRFMPYNNPAGARHVSSYASVGFLTAGLSSVPRTAVGQYKPNYEVHNRFSPFGGAIVVKGAFYIHAGPENLSDAGWGSAGCVEIIGNFDDFKKDVLELSGATPAPGNAAALNAAVGRLVSARKLFVTYESATRPNLRAALSRQVDGDGDQVARADLPSDPTDPTDPSEPLGTTSSAITSTE